MERSTIQKIEELSNKIDKLTALIEKGKEEILTSKKVCDMLDISDVTLWKLDKEGVTIPIPIAPNSKSKYYLLSDIMNIFLIQRHKKSNRKPPINQSYKL